MRLRHILCFSERHPAHTRIVLGRNFRSRAEILEAAARCVSHNERGAGKALIAMRGSGGRVRVRAFPNEYAEANWVAAQIADALAGGTPPSEIRALAHHRGDLIAAGARAGQLEAVRTEAARDRLAQFGAGLEHIRSELDAGRSLGHTAIGVVTLPGGLVRHYQHQRDHTPDPERRRDAKRVLEDLRSLCRAAQCYEGQDERATLTRLPRARRGAARAGARRCQRPAHHRLDDPPGKGHGSPAGRAARLRGAAAALVALCVLAGP